jgi:hypothetical protein
MSDYILDEIIAILCKQQHSNKTVEKLCAYTEGDILAIKSYKSGLIIKFKDSKQFRVHICEQSDYFALDMNL